MFPECTRNHDMCDPYREVGHLPSGSLVIFLGGSCWSHLCALFAKSGTHGCEKQGFQKLLEKVSKKGSAVSVVKMRSGGGPYKHKKQEIKYEGGPNTPWRT